MTELTPFATLQLSPALVRAATELGITVSGTDGLPYPTAELTWGLILLGICYRAAMLAHMLINSQPLHQATPGEFAICAAGFLTLTSGLALTFAGPGLLRHVPIPPHSAYFPGK